MIKNKIPGHITRYIVSNTEIDEFDNALDDEEVAWLQIAVNDAKIVNNLYRRHHL